MGLIYTLPPSDPRLGMGLRIPATMPEPGIFLEDPDDMQRLEQFLLHESPSILEQCGAHDREAGNRSVGHAVQREKHWKALTELAWACSSNEHGDLAVQAIAEGNEAEVRDQILEEAFEAMERLRLAIHAHAGPGSATEAQVMAWIMYRYVTSHATLTRGIPWLWDSYDEQPGNDHLLRNIYRNILGPRDRAEATLLVIEHYPWSRTPCHPPDLEALTDRVEAMINESLELAASYGHDARENGSRSNAHYQMLTVNLIPNFETAKAEGWWPSMLDFGGDIQTRLGYWQSLSAKAWPTAAEADYLLAQYRNETRTIWTERILEPYVTYFAGQVEPDWESDLVFGPPGFLGTLQLEWPYAHLDCRAASSG